MKDDLVVFEYLYRDAGNFKAHGEVVISRTKAEKIRASLIEDQWFVAEDWGIPTLFHELYKWSGGYPTDQDHEWHEFVGVRDTGQGQKRNAAD